MSTRNWRSGEQCAVKAWPTEHVLLPELPILMAVRIMSWLALLSKFKLNGPQMGQEDGDFMGFSAHIAPPNAGGFPHNRLY